MWIVALALRRAVTIMEMAALMMRLAAVSFFAMKRDLFPAIDIPTINEICYYHGSTLKLTSSLKSSKTSGSVDMVLYDAASQEQVDQAKSACQQAQAALRQMKAMQGYERVTSPYDGVITARNLDSGALVAMASSSKTSSNPIFTMATLSPLHIYVQLPQVESPFVSNGDEATVTVQEFPGRQFHGSVNAASRSADERDAHDVVGSGSARRRSHALPGNVCAM